jgi:hypothetical protein
MQNTERIKEQCFFSNAAVKIDLPLTKVRIMSKAAVLETCAAYGFWRTYCQRENESRHRCYKLSNNVFSILSKL